MFKRFIGVLSAAVCAMGLLVTASANADDHKGWKHRRDSHHYHRGHDRHGPAHSDRRVHASHWTRHDHRAVRYVRPYWNHRCNDRRHYAHAHFHVPVSYYRSDYYSRYPYRGVYRDRGAEATVILSFPL
jgi:hypothetical protein